MSVTHDLSDETNLDLNPKYIEFAEEVIFYIVTIIGNSMGEHNPVYPRNWKSNDLKGLVKEIAMIVRSSLEDETFESFYERYIEFPDFNLTAEEEDEFLELNADVYNHVIGEFPSFQNFGRDDLESAQDLFSGMLITLYEETVLNSNIKSANKKQ